MGEGGVQEVINKGNIWGNISWVKGLRVLSLKVKEIVCEKKETSYKEVAESLVQGLNLKEMEMVEEVELKKKIVIRERMNKM